MLNEPLPGLDTCASLRPPTTGTTAMTEERTFDTFALYRDAVLELLERASHSIVLFDPDLAETGIESMRGIELLSGFCDRALRNDALRIAVHDAAFIKRDCPRLLNVVARYGHRMSVRVTTRQYHNWLQPYMVVDDLHVVTRFHHDQPRGKICHDAPEVAAPLLIRFEAMWEHTQPGPTGIPLGL